MDKQPRVRDNVLSDSRLLRFPGVYSPRRPPSPGRPLAPVRQEGGRGWATPPRPSARNSRRKAQSHAAALRLRRRCPRVPGPDKAGQLVTTRQRRLGHVRPGRMARLPGLPRLPRPGRCAPPWPPAMGGGVQVQSGRTDAEGMEANVPYSMWRPRGETMAEGKGAREIRTGRRWHWLV